MTAKEKGSLTPGSTVEVPRGIELVKGSVLGVYGDPPNRHVVVEIPVVDARGETIAHSTASFPEAEVKPA